MATHVSGKTGCANSQAPTLHLGTYRRAIMAVVSADVFTPAERLRANHSVYECEDSAKLALWLKNVRRVAAEREERAPTEQTQGTLSATPTQCDEVYKLASTLPAAERASVLRRLPRLTEREASALLLGLRLRKGPRLRVEVAGWQFTVAERHYEAAKVDYVQETGTGRVLPRYESLWGGPLVQRVWAN